MINKFFSVFCLFVRYGTKEIKATLSDADTVLSNEGGKSPQIWSTAAEYVAALNTKYQAKDPPALLFFLNPPYQSFTLSLPLSSTPAIPYRYPSAGPNFILTATSHYIVQYQILYVRYHT